MPFVFKQAVSNGTDGTSAASIAATFGAGMTSGAMIAGYVSWGSSTTTDLSSITDNGTGGTWVIKRRTNDATNGACAATIYGYGWSVMPSTITANFSPNQAFRSISLQEFTGQITGDPIDGSNEQGRLQASPGTGTDGASSGAGSLTPSVDGCLIFGATVNTGDLGSGASEHTAGTNFTEPANAEYAVSGSVSISSEYEIQTTATARNASFTLPANEAHITSMVVFKPIESAFQLEQEGFRWGVDDANEASHTWEANEDTNITIADSQSRLLRVLVNATDDPTAIAYTLRYQKNGSGGYTAVPVGSSQKVTPVIEAGDATQSGNNTASGSWAVNYPNASTGDLLIFCISWDDSTNTTDVTEPAGPNSEVLSEVNATPATDAGTNVRCKVWYTVATGTWTASTLTFTPAASEQWTAAVIRVPAGEFDSGTPIGASDTEGGAAAGTATQHGAFTAGASDGSGKLCVWTAVDVNPQTVASGFSQVANTDRGAVSGGFFTRDTAVSDSESLSATNVSTMTSEDWATVAFVVRAPTVNNECYITTSGNIAGGGEATTARLTAPSGKTTSDFVTGRRWDDENGTDTIDITANDYTELEWLVALSSAPSASDFFDFRVYAGANALDTYTVTPRWTIPGGGAAINIAPIVQNYRNMGIH